MIVSKYGFADVLSLDHVGLDPSRIAAQVVTGVGFIGAGNILVRNQNIVGLTTAADIWVTAAIGMVIGSGMYERAGKPGYQERLSLTDGLRLDVETERRRNLRPRGGNR